MKIKTRYQVVALVIIALAIGLLLFKEETFISKISLDFSKSSANSEHVNSNAPDIEFTQATKDKVSGIGGLNSEILTIAKNLKNLSQIQKSQKIATIVEKLKTRSVELDILADNNPDAALMVMFSPNALSDIGQHLPVQAKKYLEIPTELKKASLRVVHIDNFDKNDPTKSTGKIRYYFKKNNSEKQLFLAGGEVPLISNATVDLKGYQLSSGNILASTVNTNLQVITTPPPESVGQQKLVVILVNFTDSGPVPFTKEQARDLVFNGPMQAFYKENSYNQTFFSGDVAGWYNLPRSGYVDGNCQWPDLGFDNFLPLFSRDNINLANYGRVLILANHQCMGGGFSTVGKYDYVINEVTYPLSESWVGSLEFFNQLSYMDGLPTVWRYLDFVIAHELGHALGVAHANSWRCEAGVVMYGNQCQHIEYGNYFDTMGAGNYSLNFNAYFKDALGWFSAKDKVANVSDTRGRYISYRLSPLESQVIPSKTYQIIKITPQGAQSPAYYIEYRKPLGYDSNLKFPSLVANTNGVFINWIPEKNQYSPMSRLLDMTPIDWSWDSVVLAPVKEYNDLGRGISIKLGTNAVSNNTANVMVKTYKPVCQNTPLSFGEVYLPNVSIYPGDTIYTSALAYNSDSPSCAPSLYNIEIIARPEWQTDLYPTGKFTLTPGEVIYKGVTINVPVDIDGGLEYKVVLKATKYKSDGTVDNVTEYPIYFYVNPAIQTPRL